jgi:hypothetical protein
LALFLSVGDARSSRSDGGLPLQKGLTTLLSPTIGRARSAELLQSVKRNGDRQKILRCVSPDVWGRLCSAADHDRNLRGRTIVPGVVRLNAA